MEKKYVLSGKKTIGFRTGNGEYHHFYKGDEVPEAIYKQLPGRVQGFITILGIFGEHSEPSAELPGFLAEERPETGNDSAEEPAPKKRGRKKKAEIEGE